MLNGGHIYLEGIMSSVNKNQIEVGHYVVIQHTHGNRNCELYPFRVLHSVESLTSSMVLLNRNWRESSANI